MTGLLPWVLAGLGVARADAVAPPAGVDERSADIVVVEPRSLRWGAAPADDPAASAEPDMPPTNDACSGAEVIPAAGPFPYLTAVTADVSEATSTGDPPLPSCRTNVSRSIWYRFTPSATALYTISACADAPTASTVDDTVMALYTSTGGCGGPFTQVSGGCDDDGCVSESLQSVISGLTLSGGTTYYVLVHKYGTAPPLAGNTAVQLRVSQTVPPPNDSCSGAIALALDAPVTGTLAGGAAGYNIPSPSTTCFSGTGQSTLSPAGRDVVYRFTAPVEGYYSFHAQQVSAATAGNLVLYVTSTCPAPPFNYTCTAAVSAANRGSGTSQHAAAEEVIEQPLLEAQTVYLFVDEGATSAGGTYTIEVSGCVRETESNNTPAEAIAYQCGMENAIFPVGDADFLALGAPAAGSRVFAVADGVAANTTDFDLRVTTIADTLEYDDANNTTPWGSQAPNVAGTPLTGAPSYLRASIRNDLTQAEPYRLYAVVQPPGTGLGGSSAAAETEPNGPSLSEANVATAGFFSGAIPVGGPAGDIDLFAFAANAGDLIQLGIDGDPLRDGTPVDVAIMLFDWDGNQLLSFTDGASTSSTAPGTGSLTATTPSSPGEAATWRARYGGAYVAAVNTQSIAQTGDYLYSIAVDCLRGDQLSADLVMTRSAPPSAPAGTEITATLTLTNVGVNAAAGVSWTETFPAGVSLVSVTPPARWICTPGAGNVTCRHLGIPTGSPQVFSMTLLLDCSLAGQPLSSTAVASSVTPEALPADNAATTLTAVTAPVSHPTADVSGSATICSGQSTSIQATLTGHAPWTVTWSDGAVQGGIPSSPALRSVSPTTDTTYTVVAAEDSTGCAAQPGGLTGSAAITVLPPLPAQPGPFTASKAGVQQGEMGVAYEVPAVAWATSYVWSYTGTGATINGSGSAVTVDFSAGATGGDLSVAAANACGTGPSRSMAVSVSPAVPGVVPGLVLSKSAGDPGHVDLSWTDGCGVAQADFAVYEGTLGSWYSHASVACSTGGVPALGDLAPSPGATYYLVVPLAAGVEGSYGTDSSGTQIPAGSGPCRPSMDTASCP